MPKQGTLSSLQVLPGGLSFPVNNGKNLFPSFPGVAAALSQKRPYQYQIYPVEFFPVSPPSSQTATSSSQNCSNSAKIMVIPKSCWFQCHSTKLNLWLLG